MAIFDRRATQLSRDAAPVECSGAFTTGCWADADRVRRLITVEIPSRVADDAAYRNARRRPDRQNARIEHDKALRRVMTAVLKDDTELFRQFSDNDDFRRWLAETVFALTYEAAS